MLRAAATAGAEQQRLDRELVEECLAGHADEFRHLIRRYERVVIAHLRARLRDEGAVEDAAQETFVRAYRNLGSLRSPEAFFSWLLGIADRVARELRRRQVRQEQVQRAYSERQRTGHPWGPERETDVGAAVASLSEPLRQVVLLRFFADRSCADIARSLGIPLGTVTKRLSRAYEHIRRRTEP